MDKPTLYLETSVISYLAARPSRDPVTARNQQLTRKCIMRCNDFGAGPEWDDPIVKEIHEIREQMAAECGYDVRAFVESIKKLEKEDRRLGALFVDERTQAAPASRAQRRPDAA